MKIVTLYSKTRCVQCDSSKRALRGIAVDFDKDGDSIEIGDTTFVLEDATTDQHIILAKELGHMQAPVMIVTVDDIIIDHWSGFRPDKIQEHAAA